jgi:hypothetical protein
MKEILELQVQKISFQVSELKCNSATGIEIIVSDGDSECDIP